MQTFAKQFYKSKKWQKCRDSYYKSVGGLCEECYSKGLVVQGEIVHHKIHITKMNINDDSITLSFDNLQLLCRDCHGEQHKVKSRRYRFDEQGRLVMNDSWL